MRRDAALLLLLSIAATDVSAGVLGQVFSCAKNVGNSAVLVAKGAGKMALLADSRPECVAKAIGQDYPLYAVSGALVGLQAGYPGTIKVGSCESSIQHTMAAPLGSALGSLIPPASTQIANYIDGHGSDEIWSFLKTVPGVGELMSEVSCGCAFVDAGVNYEDVKEVFESTVKAGESCAKIATAACDDMGKASKAAAQVCKSAINWAGKALVAGAKAVNDGAIAVGEFISGQQHMDPDQYYATWFHGYVPAAAAKSVLTPGFDWKYAFYYNPGMGNAEGNSGQKWIDQCQKDLDSSKYSAANAQEVCGILAARFESEFTALAKTWKLSVALATAWDAKYKNQYLQRWQALCPDSSGSYCKDHLPHIIGGYQYQQAAQPWVYNTTGILDKAHALLPTSGDVDSAMQAGYSVVKLDLARHIGAIYAGGVPYNVIWEGVCPPDTSAANCQKSMMAMLDGARVVLTAAASNDSATVASLSALAKNYSTSAYLTQKWAAYINKSFEGYTAMCPAGFYKDACATEMAAYQKKYTAMILPVKDGWGAVFGSRSLVGDGFEAAAEETKGVAKGWNKTQSAQDAFVAKWSGQCPWPPGPKTVAQTFAMCDTPLREAFDACRMHFEAPCLEAKAKAAIATLVASAKTPAPPPDPQALRQGPNVNAAIIAASATTAPKAPFAPIATNASNTQATAVLPPPCRPGAPGCVAPGSGATAGSAIASPPATIAMNAPTAQATAALPPSPCRPGAPGCVAPGSGATAGSAIASPPATIAMNAPTTQATAALPPSPCRPGAPGCVAPGSGAMAGGAIASQPATVATIATNASATRTTAVLPPSPCRPGAPGCVAAAAPVAAASSTASRTTSAPAAPVAAPSAPSGVDHSLVTDALQRLKCTPSTGAAPGFRCASAEGHDLCLQFQRFDTSVKSCQLTTAVSASSQALAALALQNLGCDGRRSPDYACGSRSALYACQVYEAAGASYRGNPVKRCTS